METSLALCKSLIEGEVDILELGAPFSDPLADGLTNQLAAQRALDSGMTQAFVFELVKKIRTFSEVPIVLYTYYNLLFSPGLETSLDSIAEAGIDGLLTLDCPPEEAGDLLSLSAARGLKNIFIIAPTTPPERMKTIAKVSSGFLYYVSRTGVTGERSELADDIASAVGHIRAVSDLPVAVGFGISKPEHVRSVGTVADGVIVGSALVNGIANNLGDREAILNAVRGKFDELKQGLT